MEINTGYVPLDDSFGAQSFEESVQLLGDNSELLLSDGELDALGRVFQLMSQMSDLSAEDQRKQIETASRELERIFHEKIGQIREAMKAEESKGFWEGLGDVLGKVASYVGVAVAAAAAVVTLGAATPVSALLITGLCLSLAATALKETGLLLEIGIDPETAGYITAGLAIAGAVCTLIATFGASGAELADATNQFVSVCEDLATTGNLISSAASVGAGGAGIACAYIQRDVDQHYINAHEQQGMADQVRRFVMAMLQELEDTVKKDTANTKRMMSAIESQGAALMAAAGGAV